MCTDVALGFPDIWYRVHKNTISNKRSHYATELRATLFLPFWLGKKSWRVALSLRWLHYQGKHINKPDADSLDLAVKRSSIKFAGRPSNLLVAIKLVEQTFQQDVIQFEVLCSATKEPNIWHSRSKPFDLPCQTTKAPASGYACGCNFGSRFGINPYVYESWHGRLSEKNLTRARAWKNIIPVSHGSYVLRIWKRGSIGCRM
jgi:hypothetical protein